MDLTYVNYKVATDRTIAWLFDTAIRCGINLPDKKFNCDGDAKSRRYFRNTKDYGILAALLSTYTESGVRLPPTLGVVIRQAINLREMQAKKFPDSRRYLASNSRHRHFTEELKFVLQLLENTTRDIDLGKLSSSTLCSNDIISAVWPQQEHRHPSSRRISLEGELTGSESDKLLAVCTFFEDMASIRDNLYDTWTDYATGHLCLTAAAVTTDTAFRIMKASCEEIVQLVPDAPTWLALTMRLKEITDRQDLQESDFLDITCAKVAYLLNELCQLLTPGILLVKKAGYFEDYNPARDRSAWSIEDQDAEDAIILSELFVDVVVLSWTNAIVPAQDCLTAGLRATVDGGSFDSMPIYVVFAAQIFLDIHHLLRDGITRSLDSLQTTGKRACGILEEHFRHGNGHGGVSSQCKSAQEWKDIQVYVKEWIEDDYVGIALHQHGGSQAAVRPFRLLHNHPILCGLKVFRLQVLLQHSGIEMCNDTGSIVCAAHIYNAACRSGGLHKHWRDIDYIIDFHTSKRIFSGSPPSVAAEYFDRFLLALNRNQKMTYERLHLDNKVDSSGTKDERIKLKVTSPVKDVFESRYILDGDANMTLGNVVAMSHVATKRARTSDLTEETVKFLGEMAAKRRYTTTELLRIVREGVAAEELYLLFDYIGLHDRVEKFLSEMYEAIHTGLDSSFAPSAVLDTSNLVLAAAQMFDAVKQLDRSSTDLGRVASENILRSLARTISNFLGESESYGPGSASFGPARVLTNASLMGN